MNSKKYADYVAARGPVKDSFFETAWAAMNAGGELDGLSDEEALKKVVEKAEQMKKSG